MNYYNKRRHDCGKASLNMVATKSEIWSLQANRYSFNRLVVITFLFGGDVACRGTVGRMIIVMI